jgi:LAO/AO transport system kinase
LNGDRRALARAITLVENQDPCGWEILRETYSNTGNAYVVGFTGAPGVGKSTLVSGTVGLERTRGHTVGVLSVDPSSPFTHGAILGDRVRLSDHYLDGGVYIRSMATRGALGGVSEATLQALLLMDAAGFDLVILETVGVGQTEIDVVRHVDTTILVLVPGTGDAIQALKAGIMEIPDVIVVNKADHPSARITVGDIEAVLRLGTATPWEIPVIKTDGTTGAGVEELLEAVESHQSYTRASGALTERRSRNLRGEVLAIASSRVRRGLDLTIGESDQMTRLMESVSARKVDPGSAATELLQFLHYERTT